MDVKVLAVNFYIPLNDTTATPTGEKIHMKPNRFKKKRCFWSNTLFTTTIISKEVSDLENKEAKSISITLLLFSSGTE